jgi:hypothetical protein
VVGGIMGGLLANISVTGLSCAGGVAAVLLDPDTSKWTYYLYYVGGTVFGGIVGYMIGVAVRYVENDLDIWNTSIRSVLGCALILAPLNVFIVSDITYGVEYIRPGMVYGAIIPIKVFMGSIAAALIGQGIGARKGGFLFSIILLILFGVGSMLVGFASALLLGYSYYVAYVVSSIIWLTTVALTAAPF